MRVHRASTMLLVFNFPLWSAYHRFFFFFGQRIIDKLIKVIETELNAIGAYKISMPILGAKEMWQKAGRWSAFESEMFHLSDKTNQSESNLRNIFLCTSIFLITGRFSLLISVLAYCLSNSMKSGFH
ncbi:unnamed protein product [Brugia pahangi]|uniref:Proline--tRNA ligase n=1 Tax=Brugia pahangi TaxID=6280 RepID=A0A0N4T0T1_BRUPA|nr:unnamed protein product [Brugia pahangi]